MYNPNEERITDSPIIDEQRPRHVHVRTSRGPHVALAHDEHIVRTVYPHWTGILPGMLFLASLFFVPVAVAAFGFTREAFLVLLALFALIPIAVLLLFHARHGNALVITNKGLICAHGFFDHVHRGIPVGQITNVSTHHDLIQKLLGTGTVEIDVAGQFGPEVFPNIPEPEEVAEILVEGVENFEFQLEQEQEQQQLLQQQQRNAYKSPPVHAAQTTKPPLDEIERLYHLLTTGAITEDEYNIAKRTLLEKL